MLSLKGVRKGKPRTCEHRSVAITDTRSAPDIEGLGCCFVLWRPVWTSIRGFADPPWDVRSRSFDRSPISAGRGRTYYYLRRYIIIALIRSSAASLIFYPHAHTRHESLQIEMLHAWDGTRYSSFHPILYEHLWIRYRKQGVERRISHIVKMSSLASLTHFSAQTLFKICQALWFLSNAFEPA